MSSKELTGDALVGAFEAAPAKPERPDEWEVKIPKRAQTNRGEKYTVAVYDGETGDVIESALASHGGEDFAIICMIGKLDRASWGKLNRRAAVLDGDHTMYVGRVLPEDGYAVIHGVPAR